MFKDRLEAGYLLAERLKDYSDNCVIAAIPRGGVPVGYIISKELDIPLELVLSKKIGHPHNKEYAIGAVTLNSRILSDTAIEVSEEYIESETDNVRELLLERQTKYYGDRKPINLEGKVVIIVDDGIATGNTLISCIQLIQQQNPLKIIVALPVAPYQTLSKIEKSLSIDEIICLLEARNFYAVGQFYEDFSQVSDTEVISFLQKTNNSTSLIH